jgi:hypothetical protein
VVSMVVPTVPVTVTVYVPAVVPVLPPPPPVLALLLLQPIAPRETNKTSSPSIASQLRRRLGIPKNSASARAAPPVDGQNKLLVRLRAVVAAVVETVSVEVPADAPLIVTEAGERLHVAGSVAPEGPETLQARATVLANPPDPVTLMVEVLPVVAPGLTVMLPLLVNAYVPTTGAVTVTFTVVVGDGVIPPEPVTVTT